MSENKFYDCHKWVRSSKDIPDGEEGTQYAIIVFGSVWIPGDERSREAPGHGYGARTEQKIEFILFQNKTAWEEEIADRTHDPDYHYEWFPMIFRKAKVTTTVNVRVEPL